MKRLILMLLVSVAVLMMAACTPPLTQSDKNLMEQAIAASNSAKADADRAEAAADRSVAAADRSEAAAQRAEDAALKCERVLESSMKK